MLETNRIYNIDCLSGLKILDNECIDVVVTSPSYYNAREYSYWETMMNNYQTAENEISENFRQNWRRNIVKINPIIKINCKGERS